MVEPVSLASNGFSNPGVLANPAASVPLTMKSLRFMLSSLHSLLKKSFSNRFQQLSIDTPHHPRAGHSGFDSALYRNVNAEWHFSYENATSHEPQMAALESKPL
jgi:hypothetical protein